MTRAPPVLFPAFPHEMPVEGSDPALRLRQLIAPYRYMWTEHGVLHRLTVPEGFRHDGASVPRLVRSIIPPERLDRSAVGHDWIHHWCGALPPRSLAVWTGWEWRDPLEHPDGRLRWTRRMGDRWMLARLKEDPFPPARRRMAAVYYGLRLGGWTAWHCKEAA